MQEKNTDKIVSREEKKIKTLLANFRKSGNVLMLAQHEINIKHFTKN